MLLGEGCSSTGSDILYIKKLLEVWDIAGMKKSYSFTQYWQFPRQESMFLRHLNHQESIALVTKLVYGESVAFLCKEYF